MREEDTVEMTVSNAADLRLPATISEEEKKRRVRMALETFQGVYQHWLVIDIDKLLGNVLSHPVARASGYDQCIIHNDGFIGYFLLLFGLSLPSYQHTTGKANVRCALPVLW